MIEPPFQGRVWLSASLSNSELNIQPVSIQDEGCYTCMYNTYPDGPKSSTVCLATYGKLLFFQPAIITDYVKLHFIKVHRNKWLTKT